ncbi:putative FUN34-transmembrane protein [Violaceomyces palustris]|uniref:FUN34-transmembrane protein n=1 Tax=Violaceomyces palustris TaxID=1673888 RepID=A0ACD0NR82_9BASI|nr:putative FUN34-transmembrane protein [Violaceomyces palustris]
MSEIKGQENGNGYQGGQTTFRAVTPGGHPQDTSQPAFPVYHRKFANPAPLGLFGFAATTYTLSMYNIGARGVEVPNVVVGLALGYGGLAQFLAGMWEFASGNTFAATAFSSYGGFWFSYACILIPFFGISEGQVNPNGVPETQMADALGIYLSAWFIFTFIMLVASFRSSIGLVTLFFFLDITFLLLFIAEFGGNANVKTAGGAFGILTAAIAWYVGAAGLLSPDTSFFQLPVGNLARKD